MINGQHYKASDGIVITRRLAETVGQMRAAYTIEEICEP